MIRALGLSHVPYVHAVHYLEFNIIWEARLLRSVIIRYNIPPCRFLRKVAILGNFYILVVDSWMKILEYLLCDCLASSLRSCPLVIFIASVKFTLAFSFMICCVKVYWGFLLKVNLLNVDKRISKVEITSILNRLESPRVNNRWQILPHVQIRSHPLSFICGGEINKQFVCNLVGKLRVTD